MIKEERQKRINNIHTKNCMGKGMKIKVRRKQIELVNKHKEEGKNSLSHLQLQHEDSVNKKFKKRKKINNKLKPSVH